MYNNVTRSTSTSRMNPEGASARLQPEGSSANGTDVRLVSAETETIMVQKTILRQSFSDFICVVTLCSVAGGSPLFSVVFVLFIYSIKSVARPRCKRAIFTYIHTCIHTYIHTYSTPACDGQHSP